MTSCDSRWTALFFGDVFPYLFLIKHCVVNDERLCGLVVRVSGYRSRGPEFDSRPYHIFWEVGDVERGPLSLVRTIEKPLEWKNSGSGLCIKPILTTLWIRCADHTTPSTRKGWH
jgi:hypothetical protein